MTPRGHGLGYRPNPSGYRSIPFGLRAEHRVKAPASFSLAQFLPQVLDQNGSGSCTGCATAGALVVACASVDPLGWVPSQADLYRLGRALERMPRADGSVPPLTDNGAQPYLLMRAISEFGVRPMGPMAPDGRYSDVDIAHVNDEPDLLSLEADATMLMVGEYGIYATGLQRAEAVRSAIAGGYPVCCAVPGGSQQWQAYGGGVIGATGEPLDHFVFIHSYSPGVYTIRNSWSADYGENGDVRVNDAALSEFGDLFAMSVTEVRK
jgi:hypothetical protein